MRRRGAVATMSGKGGLACHGCVDVLIGGVRASTVAVSAHGGDCTSDDEIVFNHRL